MNLADLICTAIAKRTLLEFDYDGYRRRVEPYTLGYHKDTGNLVLSAFQTQGFSRGNHIPKWRLFLITNMGNVKELEAPAFNLRFGFNPRDKRLMRIVCTI
jgi:predicted DNA-binding transcriptional regulator YafY